MTIVPDQPIDAPTGLRIGRSSIHGNGVLATRAFIPGETIERCPVLVVDIADEDLLAGTALDGYCYQWDTGVAVALGFGSIYNHADDPNARYWTDVDTGIIEIEARRPIEPGEEITVSYNGHPEARDPIEFPDRAGVERPAGALGTTPGRSADG